VAKLIPIGGEVMEQHPSPLYIWQELRGKPEWRFQTDRYDIYRKLKRRKGFRLVAYGCNGDLWVFVKSYKQPKNARKAFERICGQKIFFNASKGIYEAENVTPQVQKAEG
jgi:hypothetical protein